MGTGDGNNLSGTGASDLIDGQGGNDILGGADGNDKLLGGARRASPVYYFRHIYMAWQDEYSAGIHQTRDHAGDPSPKEFSSPARLGRRDGLAWRTEE
ncbi:MAG: hypothetical protein IPP18_17090 [Rhodocyclaceae bacterium]|jgi:Ca2+-binding RTX toxin-like protein|nr:hypothetical protein [Rhodocyclaceae bacterium]MBK9311918.1 hypothetical protein [Rhodocyclaceae bacterium]MBK9956731.1 hypothetical protein [Rhodocyclaceae bacterium]